MQNTNIGLRPPTGASLLAIDLRVSPPRVVKFVLAYIGLLSALAYTTAVCATVQLVNDD